MVLIYLAAFFGMRRRQRAMTMSPDPRSTAAIPISHSSDSNAPVKAIAGLVLAEVVGEVTAAAVVADGAVAAGAAGAGGSP